MTMMYVKSMGNNEEFLTVDEFAELLKCHPRTIYRSIKNKKINAFRLNAGEKSSFRIPKSETSRMAVVDLKNIIDKTRGL